MARGFHLFRRHHGAGDPIISGQAQDQADQTPQPRQPRGQHARRQRHHRHPRVRRGCLTALVALGVVVVLLVGALVGVVFVPTHWPATAPVTSPNPHVKHYYMALGDSLAFGFQPNFNWDQGYAEQWWPELQRHGSRGFVDFGCNGATTQDFIHGGCPLAVVRHNYFTGSQLAEALDFLTAHPNQVSPITLDIGADDLLPELDYNTCTVKPSFPKVLAQVDRDLTQTILPKLTEKIAATQGPTGALWMLNYYDVFANKCPNIRPYIVEINQHLAQDAMAYGVPIVNVYQAFYSGQHPNPNVCAWTWRCGVLVSAIHPNTTGYAVITHALEQASGY